MKQILVALMIVAVLPDISAAQQTSGRIAYDDCYSYLDLNIGEYVIACYVYATDPGGGTAFVASGFDPAISPDGTRIAYVVQYQHLPSLHEPADIFVVGGGGLINLTTDDRASAPAWSRDGRRIAFESSRSGALELYVVNADGTGLRQVTTGVGFRGYPTWSPDDRIAFECTGRTGTQNLCSINADGTGLRRLTDFDGDDREPAFSPDGTRLAFLRSRFGSTTLEIMNADETLTSMGAFLGNTPAWSPDGTQVVFSAPGGAGGACNLGGGMCGYAQLYVMSLDSGSVTLVGSGANPSWSDSRPDGFGPTASISIACALLTCTFDASLSSDDGTIVSYAWRFDDGMTATGTSVVRAYPGSGSHTVELVVTDNHGMRGTSTRAFDVTDSPPTATFTHECSGSVCRFDASGSSDSDGRVVAYSWSFGDGTSASSSEAVVTHSYSPGTYIVRLTVIDNARATGEASHGIVVVNRPPVASFEFSCDVFAPVCAFNGFETDPDGTIVSWAWSFGDGTTGAGRQVTHTYAAAGIYNVALTVSDNHGATDTRTMSVTVFKVAFHVGDLDGAKDIQKKSWTASVDITVHDPDHRPALNARVDGVWSSGTSGSCSVDSRGICTITTSMPISTASVTFAVQSVSLGMASYDAARNHDVDGETNGTSITITRR